MATATNVLYEATKAQFVAQKKKGMAQLTVYLTNPVGVGEHSELMEEIEKQLDEMARYQDHIDILDNYF